MWRGVPVETAVEPASRVQNVAFKCTRVDGNARRAELARRQNDGVDLERRHPLVGARCHGHGPHLLLFVPLHAVDGCVESEGAGRLADSFISGTSAEILVQFVVRNPPRSRTRIGRKREAVGCRGDVARTPGVSVEEPGAPKRTALGCGRV